MNNYSEFQVNIFSNNRDIRLHLENSKLKKGIPFFKNKIGGLPLLLVWVPLLIVNNYSEFRVNIFSNNRYSLSYSTALVLDAGTDNVYLICVFIRFISCLLRKVKY